MVTIRKAVLADAHRIAQIHAEAWRAAYHSFIPEDFLDNRAKLEMRLELWNDMLAQEPEGHYVVVCDGTIAGFFSLGTPRDVDIPEEDCELIGIYFDQAYWHKGLGSGAMRFALDEAGRRGCGQMVLWVFQKNAPAIAFYEKFGFKFDGTTNDLMLGDPVTECRYRLRLTDE
jgi:Acetyltransferases